MGRNHRHKKDLKAEKAKIKLKQSKTKFLPKGLNVTNTTFKIKPIVLNEQLKLKDTNVPLSKRKLDIKDLLRRIKHHNENVRHDACEELAQMFISHSKELERELWQIIPSVSSLMQDREHKVRRAAVKVVNAMLKFTDIKGETNFKYFSTNMRCAMLNINKVIQEDSLLFLDCFIKYNSSLISECYEKLLPAFFSLLTKLKTHSNLQRMLTVNAGSKMTSFSWRITVLSRLHAVFEILVQNHQNKKENKKAIEWQDCEGGVVYSFYEDPFFDKIADGFSRWKEYGSIDTLKRHIISLVPLLYETWIEAVPENTSGQENTPLNEEASAVLTCITNTLYLLWVYVTEIKRNELDVKEVFLSNEGEAFLKLLLKNFPYSMIDNRRKRKKTNGALEILKTNNDPRCVKENLLICYMYCILNIHYLHRNMRNEMESITSYVSNCLLTKENIHQESSKYLIEFLTTCLVQSPHIWYKAGVNLAPILDSAVMCFTYSNINEKFKMKLFNILSETMDIAHFKRSEKYKFFKSDQYNTIMAKWFYSVPKLLCEPQIKGDCIDDLCHLVNKNHEVYCKALLEYLPKILENLEHLNIIITDPVLNNHEEIYRRKLVSMFYSVPSLESKQLEEIANFINQNPNSKYCQLFINMLKSRLKDKYYLTDQKRNRETFKNYVKNIPFLEKCVIKDVNYLEILID